MFKQRLLAYGLVAVTCSSCFERVTTTELAPVTSGTAKERPSYTVRSGDTLFSIAWKFDKDYKALAYYNHINTDADLKIGHKLALVEAAPPPKIKTVRNKLFLKRKKSPRVLAKKEINHSKKSNVNKKSTALSSWYWPAKGTLSKKFTLVKQQKGIDIQGKVGSFVVAANSGIVAYSGNGLRGYGNLVILRHPNNFLSAYAFNRKIFVKEGQKVKANQKIAEMGSSKGHKGLLHFEIRKNGKPINPLKYLTRH